MGRRDFDSSAVSGYCGRALNPSQAQLISVVPWVKKLPRYVTDTSQSPNGTGVLPGCSRRPDKFRSCDCPNTTFRRHGCVHQHEQVQWVVSHKINSEDVDLEDRVDEKEPSSQLAKGRWFTKGLDAARANRAKIVKFCDRDWGFRSSKADLISQPIPAITVIDGEVPHNGFTLFDIPVASKNKSLDRKSVV